MHPKFNFKFVCWYQPVYFWPCSHMTSFMGRQQQNNTPVLIQPYMTDYGPLPFMTNIEVASKRNTAFRKVLWTGEHLQLVLMSIGTGEDIGLEVHLFDYLEKQAPPDDLRAGYDIADYLLKIGTKKKNPENLIQHAQNYPNGDENVKTNIGDNAPKTKPMPRKKGVKF